MFAAGPQAGSLRSAQKRLETIIKGYGSIVVAYSGGVDSGLLSYMANRLLGNSMISVIGLSPSLSKREKENAIQFLKKHDIPFESVETEELKHENYRMNHPDRCYYCKTELFQKLRGVAGVRKIKYIAYGANIDDDQDFRPGSKAAREQNVVAPFIEARMGKSEVRNLAKAFALELWDKPASPCLASRIPYYSEVDACKLEQVELAEYALEDLGFPVCRVRHHGDIARIEVPLADRERILGDKVWKQLADKIKQAGFTYVTLDIEGFRTGRLNEALEDEKSGY